MDTDIKCISDRSLATHKELEAENIHIHSGTETVLEEKKLEWLTEESDDVGDEEVILQEGVYDTNIIDGEDKKLANWKKWIERRKKQQNYFKLNLKREPDSLVMNSDDTYEKQIKKKLIEYASMYIKFDKYRGDPKFWANPRYIKDKCTQLPINCPAVDKFDRTEVSENKPLKLEYIGIPKVIKYEKGFIKKENEIEKIFSSSHKCKYYTHRKGELESNIILIEEHKPDLTNLFIIGEKFIEMRSPISTRSLKSESPIVPEIIIESVDEESEYEFEEMNPMLEINGRLIDKNKMKRKRRDIIFTAQFTNCHINKLYSETITFENVGNVAIRYSWKKIEPYKNQELPLVYMSQLKQRFLFPSNSNIFLPGQITNIRFLFKSRESGIYHEKWILITNPIFSSKKNIVISLEACVKPESAAEDLDKIESYVRRNQARTCVQNVVNDWLETNRIKPYIPYKNLFTNKDIFLHNNPDHFYHNEEFSELLKLYTTVTGEGHWDFSILTLRNKILDLKSYEKKNEYLKKLYEISYALLKPNVDFDLTNDKYRCVYQLLCTFCNTIEKDATELKLTYRLIHASSIQLSNGSNTENELKRPMSKSGSSLSLQKRSRQKSGSKTKRLTMESRNNINNNSRDSRINSNLDLESEPGYKIRKCRYLHTLTIKTHQHLIETVDQITAIIESLNVIDKK